MFVRQSWTETRLELPEDIFEDGDDYVTLPPEFFHNIWQPDPYFLNAKVSGLFSYPDIFLRFIFIYFINFIFEITLA